LSSEAREIQVTFKEKSYFELGERTITLKPDHPNVKNASITSTDQKAMIVFCTNFSDVDTAIEQTKLLVDEINNIIIYEYGKD